MSTIAYIYFICDTGPNTSKYWILRGFHLSGEVMGYGAQSEAPSSEDLPSSAVLRPGDVPPDEGIPLEVAVLNENSLAKKLGTLPKIDHQKLASNENQILIQAHEQRDIGTGHYPWYA